MAAASVLAVAEHHMLVAGWHAVNHTVTIDPLRLGPGLTTTEGLKRVEPRHGRTLVVHLCELHSSRTVLLCSGGLASPALTQRSSGARTPLCCAVQRGGGSSPS
jgi:hypothetical protein